MAYMYESSYDESAGNLFIFGYVSVCVCVCVCERERFDAHYTSSATLCLVFQFNISIVQLPKICAVRLSGAGGCGCGRLHAMVRLSAIVSLESPSPPPPTSSPCRLSNKINTLLTMYTRRRALWRVLSSWPFWLRWRTTPEEQSDVDGRRWAMEGNKIQNNIKKNISTHSLDALPFLSQH